MQSFRAVPWSSALVTGASSGIGEAIVHQLASRGVSRIVLVARRADRLEALGATLLARHGTAVEVLAADLCDPADRARVESRLAASESERTIDLLVNNAGFGTSGEFVELPIDAEERQIALNVTAVVRLTRAALPGMVERGHGAIMNVSSMATYQPVPRMATYGGTKAFVTQFSEALYEELRGSGVTVTAVMPGYIHTEFQDHIPASDYEIAPEFAWMQPDDVARTAVTATAKGKALFIPGLLYQAGAAMMTPLPRTARRILLAKLSGLPAKLAERQKPVAPEDEPTGLQAAEAELPVMVEAAPLAAEPSTPVSVPPVPVPPVATNVAPQGDPGDAPDRATEIGDALEARAKRASLFGPEPFDPKKTIEIDPG